MHCSPLVGYSELIESSFPVLTSGFGSNILLNGRFGRLLRNGMVCCRRTLFRLCDARDCGKVAGWAHRVWRVAALQKKFPLIDDPSACIKRGPCALDNCIVCNPSQQT